MKMKKISISLFLIAFILFANQSFSQKAKFGHIDSQKLLSEMPETATARKAVEDYTKQLEDQLKTMQTELQTKYDDYTAKQSTYSDLIKKTKEDELNGLQQRIQNFQQTAQQDIQKKEQELLQPVINKAKTAIKEVAKEKGYTYIFDTSTGSLAYWPETADDIMQLVKAKLNKK